MKLRTQHRSVPVRHELERGCSRRGVALVITLILLALITTLAIAFLGLTQRETVAVDSMGRTTDAELAADSALERAKAEILAVYPYRNQDPNNGSFTLGPDMFVSTCCHNYDTNNRVVVAYDRLDTHQRITNRYDSAPPVFVNTNKPGVPVEANHPLDDRFYVDLNRNSTFEDTGHVPDTTDATVGPGRFQYAVQAGNIVTNWRVGDPQWIGILRNPRLPHGSGNPFIARHAFMVLPAGRSLDVNWIHNHVLDLDMRTGGFNGYYRNQGIGSWEINLAALLNDLNTNYWGDYQFYPYAPIPQGVAPGSAAFNDAREFLRFRYSPWNWSVAVPPSSAHLNLPNLSEVSGHSPFGITNEWIDTYGDGPLSFGDFFSPLSVDAPNAPWPGADGLRRFNTVHDLFDEQKLTELNGFRNRLNLASARGRSHDRYTLYRMLSQLGTDSIPEEDEGKIHLNYVNIASWKNPSQKVLATDYIAWTNELQTITVPRLGGAVDMDRELPDLFFLSAVTNILAREFRGMGLVTGNPDQPLNIPVYTNGSKFWITNNVVIAPLYSARIHQILQQCANILDAMSGSKTGEEYPFYPTTFRPICESRGGEVFIIDYERIKPRPSNDPLNAFSIWNRPWYRIPDQVGLINPSANVYGVPFIIGARKGFPNFNEYAIQSVALATRRLEFVKQDGQTNFSRRTQINELEIKNQFALEVWNSSRRQYPIATNSDSNRRVGFFFANEVSVVVSNNGAAIAIRPTTNVYGTNFGLFAGLTTARPMGAIGTVSSVSNAFSMPQIPEQVVLRQTNTFTPFQPAGSSNAWSVTLTNNMRFFMIETNSSGFQVLVDAVSLGDIRTHFDIGAELGSEIKNPTSEATRYIWSNDAEAGIAHTSGIERQLEISRGEETVTQADWDQFSPNTTVASQIDAFRKFYFQTNMTGRPITNAAPFSPYRLMISSNSWQCSDPLVHHQVNDLSFAGDVATVKKNVFQNVGLGTENARYIPWADGDYSSTTPADYDARLRDSSIVGIDRWQFPEGPFASVGWLGRVHRGTPWQTVYFKSDAADLAVWKNHSGNARTDYDALSIHPTNDWRLADYFTASIHPNATQGRLSINQTNLAAWSALLSGVIATAPTNNPNRPGLLPPYYTTNVVIQPAGVFDTANPTELARIANAINQVRATRPNRQFTALSEILSVPELSYTSPLFVNPFVNPVQYDPLNPPMGNPANRTEIYDSDYERLPEQILGLLKVGEPRFVIYSWGQSLKPARVGVQLDANGKVDLTQPLSGPSITIDGSDRIVNNYQVTGEVATKAVVRVVFPEPLSKGEINYRKPKIVVESFNVIDVE